MLHNLFFFFTKFYQVDAVSDCMMAVNTAVGQKSARCKKFEVKKPVLTSTNKIHTNEMCTMLRVSKMMFWVQFLPERTKQSQHCSRSLSCEVTRKKKPAKPFWFQVRICVTIPPSSKNKIMSFEDMSHNVLIVF